MDFAVVGLSHHTAGIELRERLAIAPARLGEIYRDWFVRRRIEGVLLSTCNRVEVLTHGLGDGAGSFAREVLTAATGVDAAEFAESLREFRGEAAVRHAFRVASGLDSMVLGEPQILGQWKEAFLIAERHGAVGPFVSRLGQRTLQVAKRVRTDTEIGRYAINLSSLAVDLAEQIFQPLTLKRVLVIGAGEMAELAVERLRTQGVGEMVIANRTFARAEQLARTCRARAVSWECWPQEFAAADIVIVGAGADQRLIALDEVRQALRGASHRPRLIIDLAVPRAVDPDVGNLEDVFLYGIDDLEAISRENRERRAAEAERAEAIVIEAVARFHTWYGEQSLSPALAEINRELEMIRTQEIARSLQAGARRSTEELLDAATQAVLRRIMQRVAQRLRARVDGPQAAEVLRALITGEPPSKDEDA